MPTCPTCRAEMLDSKDVCPACGHYVEIGGQG